jgi:dienelactone hydrolase
MNRRTFLKGMLGGVAISVALPPLEAMMNTHGTAYAGGSAFPTRFGIWYWGNGVLPDLFGSPGREPSAGYLANSMLRACVSREFVTFATNRTSPIVRFLRALALSEHERCGGPGVGAVGMCLTGGFSLAMCVDPIVIAPVMSQPSLPLPIGARRRRDLGISEGDLAIIKDRTTDGLCAMGLRFSGDRVAPAERFARLQQELGSNFIGVQIDSSQPNPWGYATSAHSVLTEDYVDEENSPTRQALDGVLNFLESRLLTN